jgi:hypothetical protein
MSLREYLTSMLLPGRLETSTLGDLLGALHRLKTTGVLELIEERGTRAGTAHRVYLHGGLIQHVDTCLAGPPLGDLLRRHRLLDSATSGRFERVMATRDGRRAGDVLVEERLLSPTIVATALRRQLIERLESLFELGSASVRFHVMGTAPRVGVRALPLFPAEFLHGRPRARDRGPSRPHHTARSSSRRVRESSPVEQAWKLLGLEPGTDLVAVRRAFRTIAARLHPDRHPHASHDERVGLMRRFAELSAAYHSLTR